MVLYVRDGTLCWHGGQMHLSVVNYPALFKHSFDITIHFFCATMERKNEPCLCCYNMLAVLMFDGKRSSRLSSHQNAPETTGMHNNWNMYKLCIQNTFHAWIFVYLRKTNLLLSIFCFSFCSSFLVQFFVGLNITNIILMPITIS